jgi:CelD/BcsL family acetyltransferase involved in cellulose biosynthesis
VRTPTIVEAPIQAISVQADPARLQALEPEWRVLHADAGASPFLAPEWLLPFHRRFAVRRPLRVVEARGPGGRLDGLALLSARGGLPGAPRWHLLGNGLTGADDLDLLVRPDVPAARTALAGALLDAGLDALDLEDLPCGSPTVAALRAAAVERGARVAVTRRFACPGFAVRGRFEEHLARIRRRETYGRRVRWLAKQDGFRIDVTTSPAEAAGAMDDVLRLHRLRWTAEGGSYGIPPGPMEDFHREVAPLLAARGWLRLYRLFVGGTAIAAVYGLEVGKTFFYYQSGYDPAWSARSPGVVLTGRTVEDAYARGLAYYDFLRGEEAYKLDWAADRRETCVVRVRTATFAARAADALDRTGRTARGLARALVPAATWAALQRARRRLEAGAAIAGEGRA